MCPESLYPAVLQLAITCQALPLRRSSSGYFVAYPRASTNHKQVTKPRNAEQAHVIPKKPKLPARKQVLLEKAVLGTLHESALLQQAACSPFQADYPGVGLKTQARSTMLIQSLNPSEPKETSVAALESRSCKLQPAMGGQTAPSIAVQFNTSTANFACSQPPFLKGNPGLPSKEF